ncbi:Catechol 2,3-dioxygenase [Fodinibius roseus]|uniref:Catechol 2,3-dioxygenase n=1 Tax=Fodinibius roseus TaxID=1194090 RepID=A0A1M4YZ97_9BACT|nr:VOC family protein [Fodinibius roseus]SHF11131.1 Catechol 2,3-dioxygenase [Fodinibius roseus]
MITNVIQVTIFVKDQEEAKKFYTEKLGFVVRNEMDFGEDWKYLTVAPNESNETVLELAQADSTEKQALIGNQAGDLPVVMFKSDDIEKGYEELHERDVQFEGQPKEVPGGKGVRFQDLDGNLFDLYEPQQ